MKTRSACLLFVSVSSLGSALTTQAAAIGASAGCFLEDWRTSTVPLQDCSFSTVVGTTTIESTGLANLETGHLAGSATVSNTESGRKRSANSRTSISDTLTFSRSNAEGFSGQILIPIAGKFSGDIHLIDERETVDATFALGLAEKVPSSQYGSFAVYTQFYDGQVSLARNPSESPFSGDFIQESIAADSFSATLQLNFFWTPDSSPFNFFASVESGNRFDGAGSVTVDMFATQGIQFILPDDVTMTSASGYFDIPATASPVPAPATFWLALLGTAGLIRKSRKRRAGAR